MKSAVVAALAGLTFTTAWAAGPNLVVNGSFEADLIPLNSWSIRPTITGWVGAPDIELQHDLEGNVA